MAAHRRAALYYDFADFSMIRLSTGRAFLNAGFGRAHRLTPRDLTTPPADA
ncbi:hypothetical protein [Wenxinia marina]|uniref:Uncharacterized protein n=1 Tax=Wenxinia marina DSM 24838 TaxID=1123501 RepID=A0A0D0NGN6_9RHOB|nr:hypothetical protein [Wenxinia marina]KIQ67485.1 hypothetical protein Wenmar_03909 [Wenxinia marina DSM 24838]GGL69156.1 hypothetical protein GCM10011392_24500 [Wenxinia marina]